MNCFIVGKGKTKDGFIIWDIHEGDSKENSRPVAENKAIELAGDAFEYGKWYDTTKEKTIQGFLHKEDLQQRKKQEKMNKGEDVFSKKESQEISDIITPGGINNE